ncbi:hypothetical protein [Chishuiella sp.]|uniref:hypothetical protein n=1 Tax=Chishuiella sp. TaxID=1969467 RepID=UPI0028ABC8C1|nr:hypothetical protein [Chishuiella sp.]
MKYIFYICFVLASIINAQTIQLNISDYSNNLPINDADIYFAKSTKNFVSDDNGKAMIDLSNIDKSDEIIISKKDYQDAKINVNKINSESIKIKLEKVGNIELQEAFISNLKAEDILKKVIENYDNNFKVEKYYFLVNLQQKSYIDSSYLDLIDVDLQLKFTKGKILIKSNGRINKKHIADSPPVTIDFNSSDYLRHLYLYDGLKTMHENLLKKQYNNTKVIFTKYADKPMFEVYLDKNKDEKNYLLIDKETFSVIQYTLNIRNEIKTNTEKPLKRDGIISFKYRPYMEGWVLKESDVNFLMSLFDEKSNKEIKIDLDYKITAFDFSTTAFPEFKKTINIKSDIRKNFN